MAEILRSTAAAFQDASELDIVVPTGESFETLIQRRQEAKEKIGILSEEVKELDNTIGSVLDLNQIRAVTCKDYLVTRRDGAKGRTTIDKMKLLELGVAAHIIAQATVESPPTKPSVSIRRIGDKS